MSVQFIPKNHTVFFYSSTWIDSNQTFAIFHLLEKLFNCSNDQLMNWLIDWLSNRSIRSFTQSKKKQHNRSTIADLSIVYTKDSWRCFWLNKKKKLISVRRERETERGLEKGRRSGIGRRNLPKLGQNKNAFRPSCLWTSVILFSATQSIHWMRSTCVILI